MPKKTLIAIGAGVLSAFAATAFMSQAPGAMMLVYFANLPLFMAGFGLGPQAMAISGGVGFMIAGMLGGGLAAGIFGMSQVLPAWLVVRQLLLQRSSAPDANLGDDGEVEWYPIGDTLCWLALLAAAALLVATFASLSDGDGLSVLVSGNLDSLLQAMVPEWEPAHRETMIGIMAPMFPGAIGVSWLIMTVVNATLAQSFLVKSGRALRPTPAYIDLALPQWISWPMIGAALLALIGSGEMEYTGRNLAMILAVPFFLSGLSVVHTWARQTTFATMALVSFYMVLVLWGWASLIVAGIGVFELWSGLRRHIGGATNDNV